MNLPERSQPGKTSDGPDVARIRGHVEALTGIRHPDTGPKGLDVAANYIGQRLYEMGAAVSEHFFKLDGFCGVFRNVEGLINAGTDRPELVICAHYDTVWKSPGAGDNASGVAAMLEAARLLIKHRAAGPIRFIGFTLEEGSPVQGDNDSRLIGSREWVDGLKCRCIDIGGVINLESVGYVGDSQNYPKGIEPDCFPHYRFDRNRGDFVAIVSCCEHSNDLGRVCFDQCRGPVDLPAVFVNVPLQQMKDHFHDLLRSDHYSFWERGLPAIMLTDTAEMRTPHYHKPSDTAETLNMEFARKVCLATVLTIMNI